MKCERDGRESSLYAFAPLVMMESSVARCKWCATTAPPDAAMILTENSQECAVFVMAGYTAKCRLSRQQLTRYFVSAMRVPAGIPMTSLGRRFHRLDAVNDTGSRATLLLTMCMTKGAGDYGGCQTELRASWDFNTRSPLKD
ncbi:hypothetical protein CBL_11032 [Carabus blaptoides fortunei]